MTVRLKITYKRKSVIKKLVDKLTIGRSSQCDIVVDDSILSGKHGEFVINKKFEVTYTDLNSTNGSYLKKVKVQNIKFKLFEVLYLGQTTVQIDEELITPVERMSLSSGLFNQNTIEQEGKTKITGQVLTLEKELKKKKE
jgi:pSer/pThr/pTyr-binding forkhead associated (FHA) protein